MASEQWRTNWRDYYEILELDINASPEEIKKAYRRLAKNYHPDYNPGNEEAAERFKEINEAHDILSNTESKAEYDREYNRRLNNQNVPDEDTDEFDYDDFASEYSENERKMAEILAFRKALEEKFNEKESYIKRRNAIFLWIFKNNISDNDFEEYRDKVLALQDDYDAYIAGFEEFLDFTLQYGLYDENQQIYAFIEDLNGIICDIPTNIVEAKSVYGKVIIEKLLSEKIDDVCSKLESLVEQMTLFWEYLQKGTIKKGEYPAYKQQFSSQVQNIILETDGIRSECRKYNIAALNGKAEHMVDLLSELRGQSYFLFDDYDTVCSLARIQVTSTKRRKVMLEIRTEVGSIKDDISTLSLTDIGCLQTLISCLERLAAIKERINTEKEKFEAENANCPESVTIALENKKAGIFEEIKKAFSDAQEMFKGTENVYQSLNENGEGLLEQINDLIQNVKNVALNLDAKELLYNYKVIANKLALYRKFLDNPQELGNILAALIALLQEVEKINAELESFANDYMVQYQTQNGNNYGQNNGNNYGQNGTNSNPFTNPQDQKKYDEYLREKSILDEMTRELDELKESISKSSITYIVSIGVLCGIWLLDGDKNFNILQSVIMLISTGNLAKSGLTFLKNSKEMTDLDQKIIKQKCLVLDWEDWISNAKRNRQI